jgi:hypothetical protein
MPNIFVIFSYQKVLIRLRNFFSIPTSLFCRVPGLIYIEPVGSRVRHANNCLVYMDESGKDPVNQKVELSSQLHFLHGSREISLTLLSHSSPDSWAGLHRDHGWRRCDTPAIAGAVQ